MERQDGSWQQKAMRSGMWVAVSSVTAAMLQFARNIVLARLLSPEIFGLMAICLLATRLIDIFTEPGFSAALIHRQGRFEDARDTAFTLRVLRGGLLALATLAMAPWVARFYEQPILESAVAVVGLTFFVTAFQNMNSVALQKELDFKRLTYMELVGAALQFIAAVVLAWWLRSVWALVWAQLAHAAISTILSFVMIPGRVRFHIDREIARELFRYGRYITGIAIVLFISRELDNALIGKLLGMTVLGYYVAAFSFANIPATYLSKLVAKIMFPLFAKLQSDRSALQAEYGRSILMVTTLAVPVSALTIVLAPEIVLTLYGPRWTAATIPLQILTVYGCFRSLWMMNGYLYNAIGRPQVDFYMGIGRLAALLALLYPLTVYFGLVGASIAVASPMVVQYVIGVFLSRHFLDVPVGVGFKPLAAALGQAAIVAAVLVALRQVGLGDPRLALLVLGTVGVGLFVVLNRSKLQMLRAAVAR